MMTVKKDKHSEKLYTLIDTGLALSSEKDLIPLFELILEKSLSISQVQAVALYLTVEKSKKNISKNLSFEKESVEKESVFHLIKSCSFRNQKTQFMDHDDFFSVKNNKILGLVASEKEVLNISSFKEHFKKENYEDSLVKWKENNKVFEKHFGADVSFDFRIFVPMITPGGHLCGILELVDKKSENRTTGFGDEDEEFLKVFSTYSAIALENANLTEKVEHLFESFVHASIKAIESRDPSTSGHSDRVAMMTVELALATHKIGEGLFKNVHFTEQQIREIRYASLLHDFGKIGVSESVLLKKKKLKDRDLQSILTRFDNMSDYEEKKIWKNLCDFLIEQGHEKNPSLDIDKVYRAAQEKINTIRDRIRKVRSYLIAVNEPQVIDRDFDVNELIEKITKSDVFFEKSLLKSNELKNLTITRGSLNEDERREIESHVSHTYDFLKQIAWTDSLSCVPEIAHFHHEKLDGSGYPTGIKGESIPIQSKMMTIADIYDALAAFDRPYKKQVSPGRALDILVEEARMGKIDGHLLKIFIEARVFNITEGNLKKAS